MGLLLLLFIALPAVELALLIEVGRRIGTIETLALIVVTGMIGASLARYQGVQVLRQVEAETREGRLPAGALVDGIIILIAAALLVTPGVLTDAFGFLCLVPGTRRIFKTYLRRWFERRAAEGRAHVEVHFADFSDLRPGRGHGPVYDVTPEEEPPNRPELPPRERS